MQKLTIVIPNFNGADLLRRNLPSVIEAAIAYSADTEIIVVDDGSRDDSVAVLGQQFPTVKVVCHDVNRGFSEAVHTGVRAAGADLLFLLNSDVELHQNCLEKLAVYFDNDLTFSVSPLMINDDGNVNRHSWNLRYFERGYLKLADWDLRHATSLIGQNKLKSLYSSGGSMMVRKSKFIELGGFHPIFKPFYGEDFDLGIRAWYKGWPSYFEPRASVLHQSHGSIKNNVARQRVKEIRRRNRYFLEWIHFSSTRLICSVTPYTILQLLGELVMLDRTNLRGFWSAISNFRAVVAARKEIAVQHGRNLESIINELLLESGTRPDR